MSNKTRLELTWPGKENRPRLEPRILIEDPALSYHAEHCVTDNDIFDNRLIFGDNLLALKALEQEFAGKVKCIYIDPPFNTGEAMPNYDDGVEHSIWLSLMRDRLDIIVRLLAQDGSLFVHLDDNELGYTIVLLDELVGRENRIGVITFKQSSASGPKAINPGLVSTSNFILYYVKDKRAWKPNKVFVASGRDNRYNSYITNYSAPFEEWSLVNLRGALAASLGIDVKNLKAKFGTGLEDEIERFVLTDPKRVVRLARVNPKDVNADARIALDQSSKQPGVVQRAIRDAREDYYFLNGEQLLFYSSKTKEVDGRQVTAEPLTGIWDDLLSNNLHNEGGVSFPKGKKPEALIKRIW